MKKVEIFQIPFKRQTIIYVPLKRLAFIGNKALVSLIAELADGRKPDQASLKVAQAIEFIEGTGLLSPDSALPQCEATIHYQPICATLFLTNRCNLRCIYCYASGGELSPIDMPVELTTQAIDIVCNNAIDRSLSSFDVGFHGGGEPTLNWKVLTSAIAYARKKPIKANISASSNGYYTKEKLAYILDNFDGLSLSFDGPPEMQNIQRPRADGRPSFPTVMKTIEAMDKRQFPYGIRMTVTISSAENLPQAMEFLSNNTGAKLVQVEPTFPRGRGKGMAVAGKAIDTFIKSFKEAYELAESKDIELFYSGARLDTLTTQFCTAPCNALVVLQTGEISTCFEVHNISHPLANDFIFGGIQNGKLYFDEERWHNTVTRTVEDISYCKDCFCKFHCAGDCLGKTFSSNNDGCFKPSHRCKINRELIKYLILKRIAQNNSIKRKGD